jgi:hypothetical protein
VSSAWTTASTQLELDTSGTVNFAANDEATTGGAGAYVTILDLAVPTSRITRWNVQVAGRPSSYNGDAFAGTFQTFLAKNTAGTVTTTPSTPALAETISIGGGSGANAQIVISTTHIRVQVKDDGSRAYLFNATANVAEV